jgi:2-methylisocitrate lyase-like PEP mutase family enzyme
MQLSSSSRHLENSFCYRAKSLNFRITAPQGKMSTFVLKIWRDDLRDQNRLRTTLTEYLRGTEPRLAPSIADAFGASVIEMLQFDAAHVSGQAVHKSLALADAGLITLDELESRVRSIADAVSIPIIVDGETGFGNVRNTRRTVRALERAGASAIHFEDQVTPRRYRAGGNVPTIPLGEMVDKLKAALDERIDPRMLIIGRCEDRTSKETLIERLITYAETGIDGLWSSAFGVDIIKPVREAANGIRFIGVPTDRLIRKETAELGVPIMIFPTISTVAAAWGMVTALRKMRDAGSPDEAYRSIEGLDEIRTWFRTVGEDRYPGSTRGEA